MKTRDDNNYQKEKIGVCPLNTVAESGTGILPVKFEEYIQGQKVAQASRLWI